MGFLRLPNLATRRSLALFVVSASASLLCAQAPPSVLTEPAAPLLPQQFGAWQLQGPLSSGTDPGSADAPHASELKEDGLQRFALGHYTHGSVTLDVQALQFGDATGASAGFSFYRALLPALRSAKLGEESAANADQELLRAGNTLILAKAPHLDASGLQALALMLPKIGGPKGQPPLLPTLLPHKGLDAASVRYSVGPVSYGANGGILPPEILGFEKAAEEVTATYTSRSGKGTLTLLLYPTPQIAGDHGRSIEGWVNNHHDGLGTVKMRREGPLVAMTTGSLSPDDAQRLVENTHLHSEVTWNKQMPLEFHTEVRKTASLLSSIMVLSGVLMLAAVLLGLFLGVGRASIRVLMGKSAAVEPEFLGLGLERGPSKPIARFDDPARS